MDSLLTDEQREKLRKLDAEMETRRQNQSKKEETSRKHGIPIDVVDMDVVKIGIMLGLIKKISSDGTPPSNGGSPLLDLLLGSDDSSSKIDTSLVPKYYSLAPQTVSEANKIHHQEKHVHAQTEAFSHAVTSGIKAAIARIRGFVYFNIDGWTIDNFKNGCFDTMEVLLDSLREDGDDETWETLQVVRNALFGFVNICDYRQLLKHHISRLTSDAHPHAKVVSNLTLLDRRLSMYSNSLEIPDELLLSAEDANKLIHELRLRSYMKNPTLTPFNFDDFVQECCTPSLLCVPIDVVLNTSLVGPYMNNSIGFLASNNHHHTFYVLDKILPNGIRLWVIDIDLIQFCESLIKEFAVYLIKIFRTFYKARFTTNKYIPEYISLSKHRDVFENILKSLQFICEKQSFHQFIKRLVISKSCIIPTEYDYFNYIETYQQLQAVYFEKFDKLLYESITNELFDT